MVNTAVVEAEVLEEKMPESPWHNKNVEAVKELLDEVAAKIPNAVVFRDLFFRFGGKQYAPDLAVVIGKTPPLESIGLVYRVPEDGDAPVAIVEVAVSPKSLGEALSEKADFYAEMGVKDYLIIEAFPQKPLRLWFCRPNLGERPNSIDEAKMEALGITVKVEGQVLRVFDKSGDEVLTSRSLVSLLQKELERARRELEQTQKELEQTRTELAEERRNREELARRVAELERKLQQQT